jgi:hypothetical protein
VGGWCDVLSFHDYSPSRERVNERYEKALEYAKKFSKPIFCSEAGCPGRGNPYDLVMEAARRKGIGFILWELMIGKSFWADRHGIVYPDGTIRDPAIVAALAGFYRKRDGQEKDYNLNTEGIVDGYLKKADAWLADSAAPYDEGLGIVNTLANLVESGGIVPLNNLPTARVIAIEKAGENRTAVRALINEWTPVLKADADKKRGVNQTAT